MMASCSRVRVSFARGYQQTYHDRSATLFPNTVFRPGWLLRRNYTNRSARLRSKTVYQLFKLHNTVTIIRVTEISAACTGCMYGVRLHTLPSPQGGMMKSSRPGFCTAIVRRGQRRFARLKLSRKFESSVSFGLRACVCRGAERIVGRC